MAARSLLLGLLVAASLSGSAHATAGVSDPVTSTPSSTVPVDAEPDVDTEPARTGPRIVLDRTEVELGEPIIVTLTGFTSQQATVAVCGNLAKRGSTDCNMPQSQSERIRAEEPETLTQLFIQEPPAACPCIVRALGTNGEFAIAPIDLVGHPIAPLVSPEIGPLIEVDLAAERVPTNLSGRLRTGLGAATRFEVTASVRNLTTETLGNVVLRARVSHRLSDDAAPVAFDVPGPIEPGQTWTQTIEVTLPAPMIGTFTWSVAAGGAGPTVEDTYATDAVPVVLYTLVAILVLDLIVLAVRAIRRSRRRAGHGGRSRGGRRGPRRGRPVVDGPEPIVFDDREPVGVG